MRRTQKFLSVFLAIIMVISIVPITANAAPDPYSGTCGDSLTWSLDETTGTLTISGEGAMDDYAYYSCPWEDFKDEIENVVINDGVTTVGHCAFSDCINIESVTIPESVNTVGEYAFSNCESLTKVVLPEGVTEICDGAFNHCYYLDTVVVPGSVEAFGEDVFASCVRLANVTLCEGLTDIGLDTFDDCTSLTDIIIPEGVDSIRGGNFSGCYNLKNITIPVSVTVVGNSSFTDCSLLTNVYYTGTEEDWNKIDDYGDNAPLYDATIHYNSTVHTHNYVKVGDVAKTCDVDGYTQYTCICGHSYKGDYVEAVGHIYDNGVVTTNPTCTVDGVKTFTCLTCGGGTYTEPVPHSGHSYDDGVITKDPTCATDGVKTFTCGNCGHTYTEAVDRVKEHDYQLVVNTSPETTGCIKTYKCSICGDEYTETVNATGHIQVIIPELAPTETKPGLTAGISCSSCGAVLLEQEIIPALGTTDDSSVIVSGTCGTSATWTYNTETGALIISGTGAMERYKSTQSKPWQKYVGDIKTIIINDGITKIDNYAFKSCSSLMYVSIPGSVTEIGSNVFKGCTSLRSVVIPDSVATLNYSAFEGCKNLIYVTLSNSISYIQDTTFKGCSSLTHVTVPDSAYYVNAYAFENCTSLKSVTIGKKIEIIYNNAFAGCTALTDVYYVGTEEQWKGISIGTNNTPLENATIHYNSTGNIGGAEHKHDFTVVTLDPTCTEKGYTSYSCDCGYEYIKYYDALGHSVEEIPLILPTTETVGYTRGKKCATCETITVEPVVVPIISETAEAGDAGGYIIWTYDEATKTMEFYGKGYMNYYDPIQESSRDSDERPWAIYGLSSVQYVVVHEGIKGINEQSFYYFTGLNLISLPSSLEWIGDYAFEGCKDFYIKYDGTKEDWNKIDGHFTNYDRIIFNDYSGVTASGTHGDNLTWTYDALTFTLTISGIGAMESVTYNEYPWYEYISEIENIVIKEGVTTIGESAFYECGFENITIPNTVTTIGAGAFMGCDNFKSITIPSSVTKIGDNAFYPHDVFRYKLEDVYYLGTEEMWNNISMGSLNILLDDNYATIHFLGEEPDQKFTGVKDDHFYKDDVMQKAYQLVEYKGDFYFINDGNKIAKSTKIYLSQKFVDGFTFADGTPLHVGYYNFDEEGKMEILNGPVGNYFYKNNVRLNAYQLVEYEGDFYFINDSHKLARVQTIYLSQKFVEGFAFADGTPLQPGYYMFDIDGKMVIINGPVGDYFYKNNERLKAYQLIEFEGDFYFINDSHKLAKNKTLYLSERFVTGFTYEDGTPLKAGYYTFDEYGRMVMLNGPVGDYFYKDNVRLNAYQLVEYEGDIYFVYNSHKLAKNTRIYLSERFVEGTDLKVGYYNFDEDGKLVIE